MLIDSSHRRWSLATLVLAALAFVVYAALAGREGDWPTGGSLVGLWYGIIGSGLMVYAGLLSALRRVPSWWWIGGRKTWLRGHIWLGTLSGLFILLHSGFRLGGPLEQVLWVVLALTLATGFYGLILQQFLPRLITARVPCESPYEQIPHLCGLLRRRADTLVESVAGSGGAEDDGGARARLRRFYEDEVRIFLGSTYRRSSPLASPVRAQVVMGSFRALAGSPEAMDRWDEVGRICEERRLLGEQERYQNLLHGWLIVHIPLSAALLVLGAAHAIASLYY